MESSICKVRIFSCSFPTMQESSNWFLESQHRCVLHDIFHVTARTTASNINSSILATIDVFFISTAERCSYKKCLQRFPSTYSSWVFKPVYTKAFKRCDYKFKIGALRIMLSENTCAGHWETVVYCMENIEKCQQW